MAIIFDGGCIQTYLTTSILKNISEESQKIFNCEIIFTDLAEKSDRTKVDTLDEFERCESSLG